MRVWDEKSSSMGNPARKRRTLHAQDSLSYYWRALDTVFRGKTGSIGVGFETATLGWFIPSGSDTPKIALALFQTLEPDRQCLGACPEVLYFAARIIGGENPPGWTACRIAESILSTLIILPEHD